MQWKCSSRELAQRRLSPLRKQPMSSENTVNRFDKSAVPTVTNSRALT